MSLLPSKKIDTNKFKHINDSKHRIIDISN